MLLKFVFLILIQECVLQKPQRRYNIPVFYGTVQPGLLYNAKLEAPIWGKNLFRVPEYDETPNVNVDSEVYAENTILDRMNHMKIGAELSLSFMGGLIKVSGSASYLQDDIKSEEIVRVTYKYNRQALTKTIRPNLEVNPDSCAFTDATHYISEISEGFHSYLAFEKRISNATSRKDISGRLHVLIDSIPGFKVEGSAELNMTEADKELSEGIKVLYRGDGDVDPPPTNFKQAVDAYVGMPAIAKKFQRPITFSIAPLTDFCGDAERTLWELYQSDMEDVGKILQYYLQSNQYLTKLKGSRFSTDYTSGYGRILIDLEERNTKSKDHFTNQLKVLLPKIRNGNDTRLKIGELIEEYYASPFYIDKFTALLNVRQKEIETIENIIYHEELPSLVEREVDKSGIKCLTDRDFTLVYELDILPEDIKELGEQFENGTYVDETNKWFMDILQVQKNQPLIKDFVKFTKNNVENDDICFVISLNKYNTSEEPFGFKLLEGGIAYPFDMPGNINAIDLISRRHDEIKLKAIFDRPINHTNDFVVTLEAKLLEINSVNQNEKNFEMIIPSSQSINSYEFIIPELTPMTIYKVTLALWVKRGPYVVIGRGEETSQYVMTRPPPLKSLKCIERLENSLKLEWEEPTTISPNLTINYMSTMEHCTQENNCFEVTKTSAQVFSGLIGDTAYNVTVKYVINEPIIYDNQQFEGESLEVSTTCHTRIPKPTNVAITKKTHEELIINWHSNLANSGNQEYLISVSNQPQTYNTKKKTFTFTNLNYPVKIKVKNLVKGDDGSLKESSYSNELTISGDENACRAFSDCLWGEQCHNGQCEISQFWNSLGDKWQCTITEPSDIYCFEMKDLIEACQKGNVNKAKHLLERGADANYMNKYGMTPLHRASGEGHLEITQLLIQNGANIDAQNRDKLTPLHFASWKGHLEIVKYLLQKGANIDAQNWEQRTPLHVALKEGYLEVAKVLIQNGANIDAQDWQKWTPLHLASWKGHLEVAKVLIQNGANIEAQSSLKSTPLHEASEKGHLEIVKYLLQKGANIDAKNNYQRTPLHVASESGHLEITKILVQNGANIDPQDSLEHTPLHIASGLGHPEIVTLLLQKGANIEAQDKWDWTPLHWACSKGHLDVVKMLMEHGANPNTKDKWGRTPYDEAKENNYREITAYLDSL